MGYIKRLGRFLCHRPLISTLALSVMAGICGVLLFVLRNGDDIRLTEIVSLFFSGTLIGVFLVAPCLLTLYDLFYLVYTGKDPDIRQAGRYTEYLTILFGALCSFLYATSLSNIQWGQNWFVQLYNEELHTPIATWTLPTVITVAASGLAGYCVLRFWRFDRLPPLLAALSIGGMYLCAGLCTVWIIQICKHEILLALYPFNLMLIAAKVTKEIVLDRTSLPCQIPAGKPAPILLFHRLLLKAQLWPLWGVLLALPLLGILIAVLTLFGQAPDSIIRAWTETSDWTLSQQVAPQNIQQDMHYLCTVAAGGHRKVVKPLRVGKRHGHRVLVNRQLCVANAFEQLLEEKLPRFHRLVRHIYDKYGYPIAKHIRSPYTADAIWLLMKPAEWFFLAVLYLFDRKPENRIAVQYPHMPVPNVEL